MRCKRHLHSILILTIFAMIVSLSAVFVLAESSVSITQPENGSTIKPGKVEVWTRFAQPPGLGDVAITQGRASWIESNYGVTYTPVKFKVFKDGALWTERDVDQEWLNFTSDGSESCSFVFEDEGTYTIKASVPQTSNEWASVTVTVKGEFDGLDYSSASIDSTNAAGITEGNAVRCTLTPSNNFMTAFKVKPASDDRYVFYTAGYRKQIRCELYEGAGDTGSLNRIDYDTDEGGDIGLAADLEAGKTYTLVVKGYVKKTNTVFDVGFVSKGSGKIMATASDITLTDKVGNYSLAAFSGIDIPESEWVISDKSVVNWDGCGNGTSERGGELLYSHYNISLIAIGNGTATVSLVDKATKKVYASCKVTCKGIPEYEDENGGNQSGENGNNENGNNGGSKASNDSNQKGKDGTAVGEGASAAVAEKAITSMKSDTDPKGSVFNKLRLKSSKQTKNSITLNWTKNSKAVKYVIYGNKCGKTNKPKRLAIVKGKNTKIFKKVAGKKVRKGTYYKFIIVALDKNDKVVSTSKLRHVATKGGKYCNFKSVTVKKSVISKAKKLRKGKTLKLNAKAVKQSKKLKAIAHRGIKYESTNKKIATVSKSGKVTAKKKGSCYVYAYAQNGVFKKIKVVVK